MKLSIMINKRREEQERLNNDKQTKRRTRKPQQWQTNETKTRKANNAEIDEKETHLSQGPI
jgi:hypothetical protein